MQSDIHFAMGGAIFGAFTEESVQLIAKYGIPGAEPYRGGLTTWLDKPESLKALLDEHAIQLITASNGGPGQSTEFIDPTKRAETVAGEAGVKMLLPSVVVMIATVMIILGPFLISFLFVDLF